MGFEGLSPSFCAERRKMEIIPQNPSQVFDGFRRTSLKGICSMFFSQKKYNSRFLTLILCLLPVLLTACNLFGGGNTPLPKRLVKAPASQQIFTVPEVGIADFDTLDPALAHDPASIKAVQLVFTGLVQLDDRLQVRPQLAQS